MIDIETWLAQAHIRLKGRGDTPFLEARALLAEVLRRPRSWIAAHPEAGLSAEQLNGLEAALQRLEAGEPLPYILGHWEFYGLDLIVTPDVLIPRPETELLVEQALAWLRRRAGPAAGRVADVGAGSGCIAVAIAANLYPAARLTPPAAGRVLATDLSMAALRVARQNACRHHVAEWIDFVQADLLPPGGPYDLVCANLPYIPRADLPGLAVSRHEPRLALDGGPDGLDLVGRLLAQAPASLAPQAALLLEIEASQGRAAGALAAAHFPAARIAVIPDLAGRDRLLFIAT